MLVQRKSLCQRFVRFQNAQQSGSVPQITERSATVQDHKFFDSADWALSKQGVKTENKQDAFDKSLEPKLEPTAVRPRRTSHLGEDDP